MRSLRQTEVDPNWPAVELDAGRLLLRRFGVLFAFKINEGEALRNARLSVDDQHHFFDGAIPREQALQLFVVGPLRESKAAQNPRALRVLPLVAGPAARASETFQTGKHQQSVSVADEGHRRSGTSKRF